MVEGVVEVEAVTCCAGDAACPIAVASALERAPILTVTDDDDWDNGRELFIAILMKQMLCKQCYTARNGACSRSLLNLRHYLNRTWPPAVRGTRGSGVWDRDRHNIGIYHGMCTQRTQREIYKSERRFINRTGYL